MYQHPERRAKTSSSRPRAARELILEFEAREHLPKGEFLKFEGVGGKDVYNITAPFAVNDRSYIAGRVESRRAEGDSEVQFFEEKNGTWIAAHEAPAFRLEDPFITKVGNELVFGGVETFPHPDALYSGGLGYRTVFYRGTTLQSLRRFTQGPDLMKDIHLIELVGGEIGAFTRPQAPAIPEGGRGKIGFFKIPNLSGLTPRNIIKARIIENLFLEAEWGGVNDPHLLEDGRIGVIGHIAFTDTTEEGELREHYYAMALTFDPTTFAVSPIRIIAARKNFPPGPAKLSPELDDVVFPGGWDGEALWLGLGDARAGRLIIPNPFK